MENEHKKELRRCQMFNTAIEMALECIIDNTTFSTSAKIEALEILFSEKSSNTSMISFLEQKIQEESKNELSK